jgi:DNA-binding transcriptional ArsR family regulator
MNQREQEDIFALKEEFQNCRKMLAALGDETRLHMITAMMQMGQGGGVRVGEITMRTNLSRPAVSHHLQILKDAGLVRVRREGTRNYYYLDADAQALTRLIQMLSHARDIVQTLPERGGQ